MMPAFTLKVMLLKIDYNLRGLEGLLMATPAENSAITDSVIIGMFILVMSLPMTITPRSPLIPV